MSGGQTRRFPRHAWTATLPRATRATRWNCTPATPSEWMACQIVATRQASTTLRFGEVFHFNRAGSSVKFPLKLYAMHELEEVRRQRTFFNLWVGDRRGSTSVSIRY